MDYKFILITARDRPIDPAFINSFEVNKLEDFASGLQKTIAEWQRRNPNQDLLNNGGIFLIEQSPGDPSRSVGRLPRNRSPSR